MIVKNEQISKVKAKVEYKKYKHYLNSLGLKNKAKLQGYMVDALALEVYEGRDKLR